MNSDDWSTVNSIAAWVAAVASLIVALATLLGVIVGSVALIFAWIAAREAGRQAQAAQHQLEVMRDQLKFSEPRPVLLLRCSWNDPFLELENVGEDLAFDVQVDLLERDWLFRQHESVQTWADLNFVKEFVVHRGTRMPLRLMINNQILPTSELRKFLEALVPIGIARAEGLGYFSKMRPLLARFSLTYKNVRINEFSSTFVLKGSPFREEGH